VLTSVHVANSVRFDALLVLQAKYEVYIQIWEQNKGKKLNAEAAT